MGRRSTRGQLFFFIIVFVLIIVAFTLIAAQYVTTQPSPVVEEASWRVGGVKVTSVDVGVRVEARVLVKATGEYVGSIVMKVRKDIALWFDKDYAISTTPVRLAGGQGLELRLSFVPDQASDGGLGGLRGYFIEVEFQGTKTSWTMESYYPPRLKVLPSFTD